MSVLTKALTAGQVSRAFWSVNQETCAHLQNHFETLHSKILQQNWTTVEPTEQKTASKAWNGGVGLSWESVFEQTHIALSSGFSWDVLPEPFL